MVRWGELDSTLERMVRIIETSTLRLYPASYYPTISLPTVRKVTQEGNDTHGANLLLYRETVTERRNGKHCGGMRKITALLQSRS